MSYKLGKRSIQRLQGVDPRLIKVIDRALDLTRYDFGVAEYGGIRTEEQQHDLFSKGLTKADGRHKKSAHQYGLAVDIYAYVDGRAWWDMHYMAQIACAFYQASIELGYRIQWGGLWSKPDAPHFELIEDE